MTRFAIRLLGFVCFCGCLFAFAGQQLAAGDDPILQAMRAEMDRSQGKLQLEQMAAPFYIEFRIVDMDTLAADASFGALRTNLRTRVRFLRVVVRVGSYKQDSFFGQGQGVVELVPVENDVMALRHLIWLTTDQAYKAATEALSAKQAQLKQYHIDQPVDDFAHADPVQSIQPLVKLSLDAQPWLAMLQTVSGLYRSDPEIEAFTANLGFQAINRYFMNSEGTVVRSGQTLYEMTMVAATQASDGMPLERSWDYLFSDSKELPSAKAFLSRGKSLRDSLKDLRTAPIPEEEYRGPVLFSADAASSVFLQLVGRNVLGLKPPPGKPARTTGAWATDFKSRVLPEFLSVVDDPTIQSIGGKSLIGHYEVDDEGVEARKVSLIANGKLENYLVGREPIRDFPMSNGHGRAQVPMNFPGPSLGNLIVTSSQNFSADELKQKLIELCRQRDLPYGYYVETMGPYLTPRLFYKVYASDGHQELVRGASFGDLDVRALRNGLIAAGNDINVESHSLNIPHSVANPSILFDELEVKPANSDKETLPEYPAPAIKGQ
ncbi:MAG TPA: metallopeptidase TldD-related protein [Terriglobales bacterium]